MNWAVFVFFVATNRACASFALQPEARLTNGAPIAISQAPYQVSIRMKAIEEVQGYGAGEFCSGAVVSQRMLITAAYCIMNYAATTILPLDASDLTVVLGSINRYQKSPNALQYDVQQVVPYPKFNLTSANYDIGIMFINGYIPWNSPVVKAIPLNVKEVIVGTNCTVTGWGKTQNNETLLMSLDVPILDNSTCAAKNSIYVPEIMLCAGNASFSGVNVCAQDAGDPLVCNGLLCGIVSKSNGCGLTNYPGYYTNISDFNSWIIAINNSFDYSRYSGGANSFDVNFYMFNCMVVISALCHYVLSNYLIA